MDDLAPPVQTSPVVSTSLVVPPAALLQQRVARLIATQTRTKSAAVAFDGRSCKKKKKEKKISNTDNMISVDGSVFLNGGVSQRPAASPEQELSLMTMIIIVIGFSALASSEMPCLRSFHGDRGTPW